MLGLDMLSHFIMLTVQAFGSPMARSFARAWTWFYTTAAPENEREARRAEVLSDLHEHISDAQTEGYDPPEIAVQIFFRTVWGIKDDVAWTAQYFPSRLADRLEKGSEILSHFGTPPRLIASVATFGLMNSAFFMSDGDQTLVDWLFLNGALLTGSVLFCSQQYRWARRIVHYYLYLATLLGVGGLLWMVFQYRLYEIPTFSEVVLQLAVAVLPVILGMAVSSKTCRVRAFNDKWWPVLACWVLITAASLGIATYMGLAILLTVWATMVVLALGFTLLCAIFTSGSAIVCYGGLKSSAGIMRLLAAGMRRLM